MPHVLRSLHLPFRASDLVAIASLATSVAGAMLACGEANPPAAAPPPPPVASALPVPSPPPPAASASGPAKTQEEAHKLVVLAASCWLGGLWGDALGEQDQAKTTGTDARCHELERRVWGAEDKTHYEQLRALEQNAVADVVAKVDETSKSDATDAPRREALLKLTTGLAEAVKETMLARRAADRVKRDLANEPEKLSKDEVDAVLPLRSHDKLEALLKMDAGDLTKEAHALALFCALDRVELARGLPKHLKLYAVVDPFQLLFGVTPPDAPQDATKKLVPGTWLKYLTEVARAAGHPVPEKAKTPRERDALAWAGMLEGVSEKLDADYAGIAPTTSLSQVVTTVLHRLQAEFHAQVAAEDTKKKLAPKK
jgi:hypothetical protein